MIINSEFVQNRVSPVNNLIVSVHKSEKIFENSSHIEPIKNMPLINAIRTMSAFAICTQKLKIYYSLKNQEETFHKSNFMRKW